MSERFAHGALAAKWREQSALRQLSPRGLGERGGLAEPWTTCDVGVTHGPVR